MRKRRSVARGNLAIAFVLCTCGECNAESRDGERVSICESLGTRHQTATTRVCGACELACETKGQWCVEADTQDPSGRAPVNLTTAGGVDGSVDTSARPEARECGAEERNGR